jgi:hypothetical protein
LREQDHVWIPIQVVGHCRSDENSQSGSAYATDQIDQRGIGHQTLESGLVSTP